MKPILKWTGGKTSELAIIKENLPSKFNRYVEPFLGGGAVYFNFENNLNIVNDFNKELVSFYQIIKDGGDDLAKFVSIIEQASTERASCLSVHFGSDMLTKAETLSESVGYQRFLQREFASKLKTIERIDRDKVSKKQPLLTFEEKEVHLQTGIIAAFYYDYRERYNIKNKALSFDVEHIAYWFIMRELAYSGMFRYSSSGNFNVPYGGISYNKKDMRTKLREILLLSVKDFYRNTEFNNSDFKVFFEKYKYFKKDDFIFLDPPYDSEFSQYNVEEDFTKEDQTRLRDVLLQTKAQIMVVIKETPFILSLYKDDFKIKTFDKSYSVNFKNRNEKAVTHLIITNY